MRLKTILNRVQKFKSFVYEDAQWDQTWAGCLCLIVTVVARANSRPICSGCEKAGPGYDAMKPRRFEFIPVWNIPVFFEYAVRRVDCRSCGVRVEKLPWASGKHTLTTVYMQFLAHWARASFPGKRRRSRFRRRGTRSIKPSNMLSNGA